MCSCDTADQPSAFRSKWRTARKEHSCSECRRAIRPGDRYWFCSGVWDGYPSSFRRCARCWRLAEAHERAEEAAGERGCSAPLSGLLETLSECVRGDRAYTMAFRLAYRAVRMEPPR